MIEETGLSKGRISQWVKTRSIPKPWRKYFLEKYPAECADCGLFNEQEAA